MDSPLDVADDFDNWVDMFQDNLPTDSPPRVADDFLQDLFQDNLPTDAPPDVADDFLQDLFQDNLPTDAPPDVADDFLQDLFQDNLPTDSPPDVAGDLLQDLFQDNLRMDSPPDVADDLLQDLLQDKPPMDSPPDVADDSRNWLDLPREVTASILLRLGAVEILKSAQMVCSLWFKLCKEPSMWRSVNMHIPRDVEMSYKKLRQLCCVAVDRSCGQLVDISVEYFGTNELLKYIANSSSQLNRLRLVSCYNISDEGLNEASAKLPLLEELDISYCSFSKETLAAVGRSCPLLKTLKFNGLGFGLNFKDDQEAFAIAQNMHELHHLQLVGKKLTDDGLQAILDECPHLESLDIRRCFAVTLAGNLGQRCAERLRDFRRPLDSTEDYEYSEFSDDDYSYDGYALSSRDVDGDFYYSD